MRSPLIELEEVHKVYGRGEAAVWALKGISMRIEEGEFVAIMGASGSGKSTCLNILGCLDVPTSGRYSFKGMEVNRLTSDQRALLRRNYIGFVFQSFHLLDRTTALENVELPLIYKGLGPKKRKEMALEALELVGLRGREQHRPNELSGGEQQRVAIARAIVTRPLLLLADEPTGNLDSETSRSIMELFRALNREHGMTVVLVTHEEDIASYARRRIYLRDGLMVREECS